MPIEIKNILTQYLTIFAVVFVVIVIFHRISKIFGFISGYNENRVIRKIKKIDDFFKKLAVGCWIVGLFQLTPNAIILAVYSTLVVVYMEVMLDMFE